MMYAFIYCICRASSNKVYSYVPGLLEGNDQMISNCAGSCIEKITLYWTELNKNLLRKE
jgi:hypothetical protein